MKIHPIAIALACAFSACSNQFNVEVPQWQDGGFLSQTRPLSQAVKSKFEGIYTVEQGYGQFGNTVVVKWNGDYLGIYAGVQTAYFIMQAGGIDSVIYIQGYWRYANGDQTGLAQCIMSREEGGRYMFGDTTGGAPAIRFRGTWGNNQENPGQPVVFRFVRPIKPELLKRNFYIVSHHGSGGTPTELPASENTVEIARIIERWGANGIEIDIRPSKDGIPILYHDSGLNLRLTQRGPLVGPAENYTFAQLESFVRLIHGEKIPSLEQFLDAVVTQTTLKFVYVDCKPTIAPYMATAAAIQKAALAKAATLGRDVQIYLAITTDDILTQFETVPGYQNIPTICELDRAQLEQANSHVWSPRWTTGVPSADIAALHAEGRVVITWTVNLPSFIQPYAQDGEFDGMLSDYPGLVAYYYYIQ
ncbi:MAG TPA: glycerophosphodiester phosphodiesterase family protein [Bacteroidota bacterium]|nr:glycerophosphodiester phosphodiesterase family protein [Bacteroidota bacterium]